MTKTKGLETNRTQHLSTRQRTVLELVVKGLTNDEIGKILQISPLTVRTHITNILSNLQVANRTEAAALFASSEARPERVSQILARPALAVSLFRALSEDTETRNLAAGFTYDIRTLFARWTWFPVINDAPPEPSPQGGGHPLGARFIVHGALIRRGSAWRLTAGIDDIDSGCLWTEKYDFLQSEMFDVHDALCASVVMSAHGVLVNHATSALPRSQRAEDLHAWELAHLGMGLQRARDREANHQAEQNFRLALDREPTLVLAQFGLGLCLYNAALNQWAPVEPTLYKLEACAQRCLDLSPHTAEGHFLIGRSLSARGDLVGAIQHMELAVGRNPSFSSAHSVLAQLLLATGRTEEGHARMKHTERLGPVSYVAGAAFAHFLNNKNDKALNAAELTLSTSPYYTFARVLAVASAWWLGEKERSLQHAGLLVKHSPSFTPSTFLSMFGAQSEGVKRIHRALVSSGLDGSMSSH